MPPLVVRCGTIMSRIATLVYFTLFLCVDTCVIVSFCAQIAVCALAFLFIVAIMLLQHVACIFANAVKNLMEIVVNQLWPDLLIKLLTRYTHTSINAIL
jgi:hypothetical protein